MKVFRCVTFATCYPVGEEGLEDAIEIGLEFNLDYDLVTRLNEVSSSGSDFCSSIK